MTDASFLRHIEFLVFQNKEFSDRRIHLLFYFECIGTATLQKSGITH